MKSTKPLLLITGFLGAGKTTLLRRLLMDLSRQDGRGDVILNDFANAEIDSATLDSSSIASVAPLAAGCACCDSLEELVLLCRTAAKGKGDLVLIELNGTADPLPLLETFTLLEDRLPFFPRMQVCVIDARHWESRKEYNVLERRQLETASFWYLSHQDEVDPDHLENIRSSLTAIAPHSKEIKVDNLVRILVSELAQSASASTETESLSNSELHEDVVEPPSHDQFHRHHDDSHKLSHRFSGCKILLPARVSSTGMKRLMDSLPDWVLRAKALVTIQDQPESRWLYEKVGAETSPSPILVYDLPNTPSSLMCIGPKLDPEALRRLVVFELGAELFPK